MSRIDTHPDVDAEHLRLLSIFHYIVGGLTAVCACIPLIHFGIGVAVVSGAFDEAGKGQPFPAILGWFFIVIAGSAILLGWAYSIGLIVAGRLLKERRNYTFCLVMAGLSCMNMPLGTCLGVFTLIVLNRPSVKAQFQDKATAYDDFGPR